MLNVRAFTLVELLAVLGIIAILAVLAFPTIGNLMRKGKESKSLHNLRQWGIGVVCYSSDNNQLLPYEGTHENPTWAQVADSGNERTWFNVIPPYVGSKALKELSPAERSDLYKSGKPTIFQCPLATWQGNEASAGGPRFSYAFNSKIFGSGRGEPIYVYQLTDHGGPNVNRRTIGPSTVAMLVATRASTREPKLMPGMNNDAGTALSYTRRASARTGGKVPIVFFDGSLRLFKPTEIMDSNGRNIPTSPVIWDPWAPDDT